MFRVALTYAENNTDLTFDFTNGTNPAHDQTTYPGNSVTLATDDGKSLALAIERVIYTRLVLVVCIFGLTGNFLNLVVLSRKSLTYSMERMEKSAHYGMMGLAVSDMLVCAAILPNVFQINGSFVNDVYDFWFVLPGLRPGDHQHIHPGEHLVDGYHGNQSIRGDLLSAQGETVHWENFCRDVTGRRLRDQLSVQRAQIFPKRGEKPRVAQPYSRLFPLPGPAAAAPDRGADLPVGLLSLRYPHSAGDSDLLQRASHPRTAPID